MKLKILACCLILLLPLSLYAKAPTGKAPTGSMTTAKDTEGWININKLLMFFTNLGSFAHQPANTFNKSDGLYFPYTSVADIEDGLVDNTVIFAAGPWFGAVDRATGDTLTAIAEFSFEFYPGPMIGGTFDPDGEANPNYRVFKLFKDSLADNPGGDYDDYMQYAVAQGAPVWAEDTYRYDTTWNEFDEVESIDTVLLGVQGEPKIFGDMFLWTVFNDANPEYKTNDASGTDPLGLEIRASCFGFNREDALGNMYFLRYRIFNKGGKNLDNMFISLWADPDLGGAGDDLVGCDTLLDMGYCYNATNSDNDYGSTPPAVGFDFFQGPLIPGDPEDVALMWDFTEYPGFVNMGMTSFNKYINGTDPQNYVWTYQYMNGLDASLDGLPLPNGTKYYGPGDPVTGTGDLDAAPDDRRWMQTTGPITMNAGDSTEILAAVVVGRGINRLSSISAMKFFDETAQLVYDNKFIVPDPPAAPEVSVHQLDGRIALEWTTVSEIDPGDYDFEGYTVFQGVGPAGPWTRLANYDLNNGVGTISDILFDEDLGIVDLPVKFGLDEGLQRYYSTNTDAINGGRLSNITDYYFRVEAYSYDPTGKPRSLTSATVVRATPQKPRAEEFLGADWDEVLAVTHAAGVSGAVIEPIVVGPDSLTGHTYRIVFFDTTEIRIDSTVINPDVDPPVYRYDTLNIAWQLEDANTGDTLLLWQTNFTGDEDYELVDGILLKVIQPAAGFANFSVVANADGAVDPPDAGAFAFQDFPVPTINDADGYITDAQQVYRDADGHHGQWGFHTADDGGSCAGGEYADFEAFTMRTLRTNQSDRSNPVNTGIWDWEMRFTGTYDDPGVGGSYAIEWFNDDNVFWVPFELWRIGVSTPDDPDDDVRVVPFIIDDYGEPGVWPGDNLYGLESWGCLDDETGSGDGEHSASGADNDPFTDWVYWYMPLDDSPGEAGYLANEAQMLAGTFDGTLMRGGVANSTPGDASEIFGRTVLVSWNGGIEPPFVQDLPELGTIFRVETGKPITNADTFTFVAPAPYASTAGGEQQLAQIRAVPNPYYLASSYDNSVFERRIRFTNLPVDANIKIYNLGGDLIASVPRDNPGQSWEAWDVETSVGIPVASGIYIYVVESEMLGTYIGKMAVFIEEEQLGTF